MIRLGNSIQRWGPRSVRNDGRKELCEEWNLFAWLRWKRIIPNDLSEMPLDVKLGLFGAGRKSFQDPGISLQCCFRKRKEPVITSSEHNIYLALGHVKQNCIR